MKYIVFIIYLYLCEAELMLWCGDVMIPTYRDKLWRWDNVMIPTYRDKLW